MLGPQAERPNLLVRSTVRLTCLAVVACPMLSATPVSAAGNPSTLVCQEDPSLAAATYDFGESGGWRVVDESVLDRTTWSGHFVPQAITAHNNALYVGYYDADRRLVVAHRASPGAEWTLHRLPGDDAVLGWDSHNLITMAVDSSGQLHVAANMHADSLRYWRTTRAGDVSSLERVATMVRPKLEQAVTYPKFFTDSRGQLLFSYRDGGSGDGSIYINEFDEGSKQWAARLDSPLFTSRSASGTHNAYATFSNDRNGAGYYEVTWVWRDTADAATNSRLSYMRTKDFVHWETVHGAHLDLPIDFDAPGVVVDDIPERGGLLNGAARLIDTPGGKPMVVYYKYDNAGNHQLFAALPDSDNGWRVQQLTAWRGAVEIAGTGTLSVPLGIRAVDVTEQGDVRVDFACGGESQHAASLIVDPQTMEVLAETPTPPWQYPPEVYKNLPTDSEATRGANQLLEIGANRAAVLRWQTQGTNHDDPFPQESEPLPVRVFDVRRQAGLPTPRDLEVTRFNDGEQFSVQWRPPDGVPDPDAARFLVEASTDGGKTWDPVQQVTGRQFKTSARDLGSPASVTFRVSLLSAEGVGEPATAPEVSGVEAPQGGRMWTVASLAIAVVLGIAVFLLRRSGRDGSGRKRRRPRSRRRQRSG